MSKISAVYKIINTVTGDFYIGSSKNVKKRWADHKCTSTWKNYPNSQLYLDMKRYGIDSFEFEVIAEVEEDNLKETEQQFIEKLHPSYNDINAKDYVEWRKEWRKEYDNQLCYYSNETITLCALKTRFRRQGISHPTAEAKKYLIQE